MAFKESGKIATNKKDGRGQVVIRIDLQSTAHDVTSSGPMPASGNRREIVLVESATVGEVEEAVRKALFGE